MGDAERIAKHFHQAYERLAPSFGYETRKASAKPWEDVPLPNRQLMTAVVADLLNRHIVSVGEIPTSSPGGLRRSE